MLVTHVGGDWRSALSASSHFFWRVFVAFFVLPVMRNNPSFFFFGSSEKIVG
jgi:hypothetical protein